MDELHVFFDLESTWVVARDETDAMAVWCELTGEDAVDYPDIEWVPCGDDSTLTIQVDEAGEISDGPYSLTKTCAEWAAHNGRGFLAAEDY